MSNYKSITLGIALAAFVTASVFSITALAGHRGKICNICGWRVIKPHTECAKLKDFKPQRIRKQNLPLLEQVEGKNPGTAVNSLNTSQERIHGETQKVEIVTGNRPTSITDVGSRKHDGKVENARPGRKTPSPVAGNALRNLILNETGHNQISTTTHLSPKELLSPHHKVTAPSKRPDFSQPFPTNRPLNASRTNTKELKQ